MPQSTSKTPESASIKTKQVVLRSGHRGNTEEDDNPKPPSAMCLETGADALGLHLSGDFPMTSVKVKSLGSSDENLFGEEITKVTSLEIFETDNIQRITINSSVQTA